MWARHSAKAQRCFRAQYEAPRQLQRRENVQQQCRARHDVTIDMLYPNRVTPRGSPTRNTPCARVARPLASVSEMHGGVVHVQIETHELKLLGGNGLPPSASALTCRSASAPGNLVPDDPDV